MPDMLPSCFVGDHGSKLPEAPSTRSAQNLVTCLYKTKLAGQCRLTSITWCKSLMGQSLTVSVDYPACQHTCNVDVKPWLFWKKQQGSKSFEMAGNKVEVFWDLSSAKYVCGPEPQESFFVAIVCDFEVVLFLGDMHKEAFLKKFRLQPTALEATLLSRKEHVFGKQLYTTKAQFFESGRTHDIAIECHTADEKDPRLSVKIDRQTVVQVKRLMWKFRGNQTIHVDGLPVEIFWDVHNWLFNPNDGHAVFMFKTGSTHEKPWQREVGIPSSAVLQGHSSNSFKDLEKNYWFPEGSCASVLHWPGDNSFKGQEPCHSSNGFSLLLYAWKNEK